MGITEKDIKEYITSSGTSVGESFSVWAIKMPSVINMALFGSASVLFDMQYNILTVSENGIFLIGVNAAGQLTPAHVWFAKEQIQSIKLKKGLMSYDVQIDVEAGNLKYRINKVMVGSAFHKSNVNPALEILERFA